MIFLVEIMGKENLKTKRKLMGVYKEGMATRKARSGGGYECSGKGKGSVIDRTLRFLSFKNRSLIATAELDHLDCLVDEIFDRLVCLESTKSV